MQQQQQQSSKTRINHQIRAKQVRLIGSEGEQIGVVSIQEALAKAQESELDLVELSPNADPPVCRIMDHGKFLFQQKKKAATARKNQKQAEIKQIIFRPVTDEGDYQVKLRNLIRFLEHGDKAKILMRFRGRELSHQEIGMAILQRLAKDLEEYGTIEQNPKMEGRQIIMVVGPKKKK
jgi:translation initiation factor IF-3